MPRTSAGAAPEPASRPATSPAPDAAALAASLAAAQEQIAALTAAQNTPEPSVEEAGKYFVLSAGVCYRVGGSETHVTLGLAGQVIDLVDSEAHRLLMLQAVRAASKDDLLVGRARALRDAQAIATGQAGPVDNPYGGSMVNTTLERHAAEQIAIARKSGALPAAV
jgi:hypothetical protein